MNIELEGKIPSSWYCLKTKSISDMDLEEMCGAYCIAVIEDGASDLKTKELMKSIKHEIKYNFQQHINIF